ncbi:hypothetical protein PR048_033134 [Dryococelus australis]|uniref:Uncharacterized protein n=1 Tax=Dryococelus australis TaxID=614101 RepID=A0ABQ9FZE2_9NEOP|nr:hypothetical protein PR048_033134 [Dryococelus australis]
MGTFAKFNTSQLSSLRDSPRVGDVQDMPRQNDHHGLAKGSGQLLFSELVDTDATILHHNRVSQQTQPVGKVSARYLYDSCRQKIAARHRNDIQPSLARHLAGIYRVASGIRQRADIIWLETADRKRVYEPLWSANYGPETAIKAANAESILTHRRNAQRRYRSAQPTNDEKLSGSMLKKCRANNKKHSIPISTLGNIVSRKEYPYGYSKYNDIDISQCPVCTYRKLCREKTLYHGDTPCKVDKEVARGTVGCYLGGLSGRAIARKVNRPKSTVAFVLRKWKVHGHCANAARSGRPPILTDRNSKTLKRKIIKNRAKPMANIRQEFHAATGVSVSIGTLRTEAHRLGYFGRAAAHKPHITTSNKAQRLRWCLDHRNWKLEQWKSVLSTDEKFCDGGVMVWSCFTTFGAGPLVFVHGSMNTEAYCNILDNEMLPTLWRFYGMDPCYFQDDNASCHVSSATMQWYADNNVRQLDWPAQSPDLNPIEHLWDELDRRDNEAKLANKRKVASLPQNQETASKTNKEREHNHIMAIVQECATQRNTNMLHYNTAFIGPRSKAHHTCALCLYNRHKANNCNLFTKQDQVFHTNVVAWFRQFKNKFCIRQVRLRINMEENSGDVTQIKKHYMEPQVGYAETRQGNAFSEHLTNIRNMMEILRKLNVKVNAKNCSFTQEDITILGPYITPKGIVSDPDKVKAIQEMSPPNNLQQLRIFLGIASYLRRYIQNYASKAEPLHCTAHRHCQRSGEPIIVQKCFGTVLHCTPSAQCNRALSVSENTVLLGNVTQMPQAIDWEQSFYKISLPVVNANSCRNQREQHYAQIERVLGNSFWVRTFSAILVWKKVCCTNRSFATHFDLQKSFERMSFAIEKNETYGLMLENVSGMYSEADRVKGQVIGHFSHRPHEIQIPEDTEGTCTESRASKRAETRRVKASTHPSENGITRGQSELSPSEPAATPKYYWKPRDVAWQQWPPLAPPKMPAHSTPHHWAGTILFTEIRPEAITSTPLTEDCTIYQAAVVETTPGHICMKQCEVIQSSVFPSHIKAKSLIPADNGRIGTAECDITSSADPCRDEAIKMQLGKPLIAFPTQCSASGDCIIQLAHLLPALAGPQSWQPWNAERRQSVVREASWGCTIPWSLIDSTRHKMSALVLSNHDKGRTLHARYLFCSFNALPGAEDLFYQSLRVVISVIKHVDTSGPFRATS